MNRARTLSMIGVILLTILIFGGLFWANLWFVRNGTSGKDFAIYWSAARTLLVFNADPYSELAASNAQATLGALSPGPSQSSFRLDLPLYAEMLIFPFASISNFTNALAAWMLILEAALVATALVCLRLLGENPRSFTFVLPFFAVFWVQAIWPLTQGNAIILATLFCVTGLVALQSAREESAGVLLALGSFKLLTLAPFLIFIIVWSLWKRRWRLPFAFFTSVGILIVLSYFFFPTWFMPYVRAVLINLQSVDLISTSGIVTGSFPGLGVRFSQALTVLTAAILLWEWWLARNRDYRHMLWVACLSLCLTPFLGLPTNPENYTILILPIALFTLLFEDRWGSRGRIVIFVVLALIFAGLWYAYLSSSRPSLTMFLPAPIAATFALYWIRWWAIRPPRTWIDSINEAPPLP